MLNCFCGMVDRRWRKAFSLISSQDHCQRSSPSRISNPPRAGFEPAQNLSLGLVEWSCAVVITATPRRFVAVRSPFGFNTEKKYDERNTGNYVEIRIEETWTLLKAKVVIKENLKTSKFQNIKVGNISSIKWGRWTCVVTYCFEKVMDISTFVLCC